MYFIMTCDNPPHIHNVSLCAFGHLEDVGHGFVLKVEHDCRVALVDELEGLVDALAHPRGREVHHGGAKLKLGGKLLGGVQKRVAGCGHGKVEGRVEVVVAHQAEAAHVLDVGDEVQHAV
eukprot:scaffold312162_cov22-Prasinocladus_malaysianus.AAC.1